MFTLRQLSNYRLPSEFFTQPTLDLSRSLLGKAMVVNRDKTLKIGIISETEAYLGQNDLACHAAKGRTSRTEVMFGPPGRLYVYQIYGLHLLLNIISEPQNYPAGILIRSLIPFYNLNPPLSGPAKLTRALGITKADYGLDLTTSPKIFLADLGYYPQSITTAPRIGINYAPEPWRSLPWRFIAKF